MKNRSRLLSRRQLTEGLLVTLGGVIAFRSLGCAGGADTTGAEDGDGGTSTSSSSSSSSGSTTGSSVVWASGGTKSMTAKATYTNPFASPATSCILLASATEGPCTEAADQVREDISEGYTGLPVRLGFRVVDTACHPVANAKVKVWHTHYAGSYSGDTPNPSMCVTDAHVLTKHCFRGVQTTDANGIVYFDTCFPGWYRGRTIHIHYTVSVNGKSFTSQVVFDDALVKDIFATHAEYTPFGQPDTTNEADNIVGNSALATYVLSTERQSDGAMLAWKQLVVFNA